MDAWWPFVFEYINELRAGRDAARREEQERTALAAQEQARLALALEEARRQRDEAVQARDTAREEAADAIQGADAAVDRLLSAELRIIRKDERMKCMDEALDWACERIDMLETYIGTLEAELERVNPDWKTVCVRDRVRPVRCGMCCTEL